MSGFSLALVDCSIPLAPFRPILTTFITTSFPLWQLLHSWHVLATTDADAVAFSGVTTSTDDPF